MSEEQVPPAGQEGSRPATQPPDEQEEIRLKNAGLAFGPNGRTLGWYRWAAWFAEKCWSSRLLPDQIKTADQAFTILCKGDELALPPFASWNLIYITKAGRLALMSKGALAVVQSRPTFGGYAERIEGEGDDVRAVAVAQRRGFPPTIKEFSYLDAERAGLLKPRKNWKGEEYESTYQTYLKDMLLSRARGRALDIAFAAELGGIAIEGIAEDIDAIEAKRNPPRAQARPEPTPAARQLTAGQRDPLLEELAGRKAAPTPVPVDPKAGTVYAPDGKVEAPPPRARAAEPAPEPAPDVRQVIDQQVDELFASGPPAAAQLSSGTPAATTQGSSEPAGPETERARLAKKGASAAKGPKPGDPCPRCEVKLNGMGGCDACSWPGKDSR